MQANAQVTPTELERSNVLVSIDRQLLRSSSPPGRGKRGGYRVIYYLKRADGVIWKLTIYPKNVIEDIPPHESAILNPQSDMRDEAR